MPDLFDVIELITDIPERGLRAGMQGTIVECHSGDAYEVEFTNEFGETLNLLALHPDQFIVIWQAKTRTWLPISERVASLVDRMPEKVGQEVLDFARYLHLREQRQRIESAAHSETMVKETSP